MEPLFELDGNLLLWIQEYIRNDFLTPIFQVITSLGDKGFIWIAIAIVLLCSQRYRSVGFMVGSSLLGSLFFINLILKNIVARSRPYHMIEHLTILISEPEEFSFPSGHTSSSFAAAMVLYLMLPKRYGIPAMTLAFLIGISRLYVGVHYPTDVIGGMLMGIFIAVVLVKIYKKKTKSGKIEC